MLSGRWRIFFSWVWKINVFSFSSTFKQVKINHWNFKICLKNSKQAQVKINQEINCNSVAQYSWKWSVNLKLMLRILFDAIWYFECSLKEGLTLPEFKRIFYMEYAHRMWGRSIGTVFLLPALFFAYKGWISRALKPRLFIYGGLLGFQVTGSWENYSAHQ